MILHRFLIQTRLQVSCQRTVALLAAVLISTAFVHKGLAAQLALMRVGYGGIAGYQLALWVSKESGISRQYGIELGPPRIAGGSLNM
jgi:hypothetical protein